MSETKLLVKLRAIMLILLMFNSFIPVVSAAAPTISPSITISTLSEDQADHVFQIQTSEQDADETVPSSNLDWTATGFNSSLISVTVTESWDFALGNIDEVRISVQPDAYGNTSINFTVSDPDGNTASQIVNVEVSPVNDAPSGFTTSAGVIATEDSVYSYNADINDSDGPSPTFAIVTGPANATINSSTGLVQWTPSQAQVGNNNFNISASDGEFTIYQAWTVSVSVFNDDPIITSSPGTGVNEDVEYQYQVVATDEEGANLTYQLLTNPTGANISSSGLVLWKPDNTDSGSNPAFQVEVDDGLNQVTQNWNVAVTNIAPSYSTSGPTSATEDTLYTYDPTTDDEGQGVTYTLTSAPSGMTIDASQGNVSWTPLNNQTGAQSYTIRADDGNSGQTDQTTNVTVTNVAVTITPIADTTGTEDTLFTVDVASDDEGQGVAYTLTTSPSGAAIDATAGNISWTPDNNQIGINNFTVQADDGTVNVTEDFTVNVSNNPVTISSSPIETATEDVLYTYNVESTDEAEGVEYTLTTNPANMSIIGLTGIISWTPSNAQVGNSTVTVQVNDSNGGIDTQTFDINVTNVNDAPVAFPITTSVLEDNEVNVTLNYTDIDAGDQATACNIAAVSNGAVSSACACTAGTCTVGITPDANSTANVTTTYNVTDGVANSNDAALTITVTAQNDAPTINLTSPNGGELLRQSCDINWSANDIDGDVLTIELLYSPDGGSNFVSIINTTDDGHEAWNCSAQDGNNFLVRAIAKDGSLTDSDDSDAAFSIDNTAPTMNLVQIFSNHSNSSLAKVGDLVTVVMNASENLSANPVVTIAGQSATVVSDGANFYNATYNMTASEADGVVAFTIDFQDIAGNNATQVTATTDSSSVTFDKTAPQATVSIASDGINTSRAATGDQITLTINASEALNANPSVTIAGNVAAVTPTTGNEYNATFTMTGAETEGVIPFEINLTDVTGNPTVGINATNDSTSVTFDKTAPTLTNVSISSNATNASLAKVGDIITLSIIASEDISGLPNVTIAGSTASVTPTSASAFNATYTMQSGDTEGVVPFTIDFDDAAGNNGTQVTATTDSSSVTFDKTLPTLNVVNITSNNSNSSLAKLGDLVTLTFNVSEVLSTLPTATIAGTSVNVTQSGATEYQAAINMSASEDNGVVNFTIDFVDQAGNVGNQTTITTDSSSVTFDKTLPTLNVVSIASNNANSSVAKTGDQVTITVNASEQLIATPTATVAGNASNVTATGGTSYNITYIFDGAETEGVIPFTIDFTDISGNPGVQVTNTTDSSSVLFDKTQPTLNVVSIASNNANQSQAITGNQITITFNASEDLGGTPIVNVSGNASTVNFQGGTQFNATYNMTGSEAEGIIPFTIDFQDASGNAGAQVSAVTDASFVIYDRTAPNVTIVTIQSNNSDTTKAKVGDQINLTFNADENITATPTVTVLGNAANVTATNGTGFTALYTTKVNDTSGVIPFTINFQDTAGNAITQVNATTDASSVTFDATLPSLSLVSISSNNTNSSLAKIGDNITLQITANETLIAAPTVNMLGGAATVISTGGNDYNATYVVQAADNEGLVNFTIDFTDTSGNAGATVSNTTDSSIVTLDKSAPTLNLVSIASNNSNSSVAITGDQVTITFNASEALNGTPIVNVSGNASIVSSMGGNQYNATYVMTGAEAEGPVTFTIDFSDASGNNGTQVTSVTDASSVTYDTTIPTLTTVSIVSSNANGSVAMVGDIVNLTFTADENLSGVPNVTIADNVANVTQTGATSYLANFTLTGAVDEGLVNFSINFSDAAGNAGTEVTTTTDASNITFDKTAPSLPTVVISSNNVNTTLAKIGDNVTVAFTTDENLSSVPSVTIANNVATVAQLNATTFNATYVFTGAETEGSVPFQINFTDVAGNTASVLSNTTDNSTVTFDKSAPSLNLVTIFSNNTNSSLVRVGDTVTIQLNATETLNGTPIVTVGGNSAAVVNTGAESYNATYTFVGGENEGVVAFAINFSDASGNNGTQVTATTDNSSVLFDETAPTLNLVSISSNNSNSSISKVGDNITLQINASEQLGMAPNVTIAGNTATVISTGLTSYNATYNMNGSDSEGTIPFTVDFIDLAGNNGTQVTAVTDSTAVLFDKTAPTLNLVTLSSNNSNSSQAKVGDNITLEFNASEELLGTPVVTIAGNAATVVSTALTTFNATYNMNGSDTDGLVTFAINFTDSAGNNGTEVVTVTDSSFVIFDKTLPTLTAVSISSNNSNSSLAKVGDNVTVAFTFDENLSAMPSVNIAGNTATVVSTGMYTYNATYNMQGTDDDGLVNFSINFTDSAGNDGIEVINVTDNSSVLFDNTLPTLTFVGISSNNSNSSAAKVGDNVTIAFNTSESLGSAPSVNIAGNTATVIQTGALTYNATYNMQGSDDDGLVNMSINFTDSVGNTGLEVTSTTDSSSVLFDKTAPTLTFVNIASNNSNNSAAKVGDNITLTFDASENITSLPVVTIAGNSAVVTQISSINFTANYVMNTTDGDGLVNFTIDFQDNPGNNGTQVTAVTDGSAVLFDKTLPALNFVTISSDNINSSLAKIGNNITVEFNATENLSGTPSVNIFNQTATVVQTTGTTYNATYITTGVEADGNVFFSINFTDSVGNDGVEVTNVTDSSNVYFDSTAPTLNLVTISSNNSNSSLAKIGDNITLSFNSSELLNQTPLVNIAGNSATVISTGATSFNATYNMQASDDNGLVNFSINFTDTAGNDGVEVTSVTDSSSVLFDQTAPTLNLVTISSNNSNSSAAKVGDNITLTINASEQLISAPVVTIAGNAATVISTGLTTFNATYNMNGSDTEGLVPFTINFTDLAGNNGTQVTAVTDATSVKFDKTAPALNLVTISSNNSNSSIAKVGDNITVEFNATENITTVPTVTIAGNGATVIQTSATSFNATYNMNGSDSSGLVNFTIDFVDDVGNNGTQVTAVTDSSSVLFDQTAPILNLVTISSNNTNSSLAKVGDNVTLTFNTSEELLAAPSVNIAGNTANVIQTGLTGYNATYVMTVSEDDGLVNFSINFTDTAGNDGVEVTNVTDSTFVSFDNTIPTLSLVSISSNNSNSSISKAGDNITLEINASEVLNQSPLVNIAANAATVVQTGATTYNATYNMQASDDDGTINFSINFSDAAGNPGTEVTATTDSSAVLYDKTAPTLNLVTISSNNSNSSAAKVGDNVTVTFNASEELLTTPVVTIAGNSATVISTGLTTFNATYNMNGSDSEGLVAFTINFTDSAGNNGTQVTAVTDTSSVLFDKTLPTLNLVTISSNNSNSTVAKIGDNITLEFNASENISTTPNVNIAGNTATVIQTSATSFNATYNMQAADDDGLVNFSINFTDDFGNDGVEVVNVTDSSFVNFDKTAPALNLVTISSNNSNSSIAKIGDNVTLRFNSTEELIGLPSVNIAGNTATVIQTSTTEFNATYNMQASDDDGVVNLSINYTDVSGNAGSEVTAVTDSTAVLFDKTAPTLNLVSISSNNSNSSAAKVGDNVTVTFNASEELITTPVVTIAGNSANVVATGLTTFNATYNMNTTDAEGLVAFTVDFTDSAGNPGTQVTAVTDTTTVKFDKTAPTLNLVSISSNNSNSSIAKIGDNITVAFNASENITSVPTVSIAGNAATVIATSATSFNATYNMNGSDDDGFVNFTIDFVDDVGNNGTQVAAVTDSSSVLFDKTLPTLNLVSISSNNTNSSLAKVGDNVTVIFNTSEELLSAPSVNIAGNTANVIQTGLTTYNATYNMQGSDDDGMVNFSINFTDSAGNDGLEVINVTDSSYVSFDNTIPTLSLVSISSNNSNSSIAKAGDNITLEINASEVLNQSPLVNIAANAATVIQTGLTTYNATYNMQASDDDGTINLSINFSDAAGNPGTEVTATTDSSAVLYDKTAPILNLVTISSNNSNSSAAKVGDNVTVEFNASEELLTTPVVTIAGNSATVISTGLTTYNATYNMNGSDSDGLVAFTVDFTDSAGNNGTQVTIVTDATSVKFDKTLPTLNLVTISSNNSNSTVAKIGDNVTLEFNASENITTTPGVNIAGNTATVIQTSATSFNATYNMQASDDDGLVNFSINFTDDVGNDGVEVVNVTDSSFVNFDKTAPALNLVTISSNNSNSSIAKIGDNVTLRFNSTEELIGLPSVNIAGNTATVIQTSTTEFNATYNMQASDDDGVVNFSINYTDVSGNAGSEVTAVTDSTAVLFDKTAPTLNLVSISSNNSNSSAAKVGDNITLAINASEELLSAPTVTIAGNSATVISTGLTSYNATYNMNGSDTDGVVAFTVDFFDMAGNNGTQVTAVTDATSVKFDKTLPTLNLVTISSNNSNSSIAKIGDNITVEFNASENISVTPTVTIAGNAATVVRTAGNTFNATYNMNGSDADGVVNFTIDFTDDVGNDGVQVTAVTDSTAVLFDKTLPTLNLVTISSNNSNSSAAKIGDNVTVAFNTSEELLSAPSVNIAGNTATVIQTGLTTYNATYNMQGSDDDGVVNMSINFTDSAGNAGTEVTATTDNSSVTFDQTVPTLNLVAISSNNSNSSIAKAGDNITLQINASEELIASPSVNIAANGATVIQTGLTSYNATFVMTTSEDDGTINFSINFTDTTGNPGTEVTATTDSSAVLYDKTAPTLNLVTISSNNSNSSAAKVGDNVTVEFNASEELLTTPVVTIAGNSATVISTGLTTYNATYNMNGSDTDGLVAFTVDFTDSAGNNGTQVTAVTDATAVKFDKTLPTLSLVTISSNNTNTSTAKVGDNVTLEFNASENISTTPSVNIAGNTATIIQTSTTSFNATYVMQASDDDGLVNFSINFTDDVGNDGVEVVNVTDSSSVLFDKTTPTLNLVTISSNNSNSSIAKAGDNITLEINASEALISAPSVNIAANTATVVQTGATTFNATYVMQASDDDGTINFSINFTDAASNPGTEVTAVTDSSAVLYDKTAPVLNLVTISSNNSNSSAAKVGDNVTVEFNASEELLTTPVVTIAGNSANVVATGLTTYNATYNMNGSDTDGVVAFTVDFTDSAGNNGTQVTAVTDSTAVKFDKTLPTLNLVTISSNNSNSSIAKIGDNVTLEFNASENISTTPSVNIAGNTATIIQTSPTTFNATYNMQASDDDGLVNFSINFTDDVGNDGVTVTAVTDSSSVLFDKTAPSLSVVHISSNNTNASIAKVGDNVTIEMNSSEALGALPAVNIAGNTATVIQTGSQTFNATYVMQGSDDDGFVNFSINYTDVSGNDGAEVTTTTDNSSVLFDKTAPTLSLVTISSNNTNSSAAKVGDNVTVTFNTSEELITTPSVNIAGNTATVVQTSTLAYNATYVMQASDDDGIVNMSINFTDSASNPGTTVTAVTDSSAVKFDKTAPTLNLVTISSNNSNSSIAKVGDNITLEFNASENVSTTPVVTIAGNAATVVRTAGNTFNATYNMNGSDSDGVVAFTIDFSDDVGNNGTQVTSVTDSTAVLFDKTLPTLNVLTISSNNSNSSAAKIGDNITVEFNASEELITTPSVNIAGNTATVISTGLTTYNATYNMQASDDEGTVNFSINFTDSAGNAGIEANTTVDNSSVYFDKSVPTLTFVGISSNNSNSSQAKVGDNVTLAINTSEELLSAPSVNIAGNTATVVQTGTLTYNATYAMQAGDDDGVVNMSINFTDTTGNPGTEVTAVTDSSSVLFDKTVPTLVTVSIASNNSNSSLAKVGDNITLSFDASENISGTPVVTIAGNAATVTPVSSINFTASYVMNTSDGDGLVNFTIDFLDSASNPGTQVTATTDVTNVTFDKTLPTLNLVTISSNNSNSSLAKIGDNVTLEFNASENLSTTPSVLIAQNAATIIQTSPTTFNATFVMTSSEDEGFVNYSINFTDVAGNDGVEVTTSTDNTSVFFDKTSPSLSFVGISSNNTNSSAAKVGDNITLEINASETLQSAPAVNIAGNTATVIQTGGLTYNATYAMQAGDDDGVVNFSINFTDATGNPGSEQTATTDSSAVLFDKTAPTLSLVTISSNNSNSSAAKVGDNVTVTFNTSEELLSTPSVSIAGNAATVIQTSTLAYNATYVLNSSVDDGTVNLSIDFTDTAGNPGTTVTAVTDSSAVKFDKTLPTLNLVTISSNNTNSSIAKVGDNVTLEFNASENISSTPTVTIAGNNATIIRTTDTSFNATYIMTVSEGEGLVNFTIDFADDVGNDGTQVTAVTDASSVTFDKSAPTLTAVAISSNNSNSSAAKVGDNVTLAITTSEPLNGLPAVNIAGNTATVIQITTTTFNATYNMQASDDNGVVNFSINYTDTTGNAGTEVTNTTDNSTVTFDKTAPALTFATISSNNSNSSAAKVGDNVTITFNINEEALSTPSVNIAGNTATVVALNATAYNATYVMQGSDDDGLVNMSINFTDMTGNPGTEVTATTDSSSVLFDMTSPSISAFSITPNPTQVGDNLTINFTASENLSANPTVEINNTAANFTSLVGQNYSFSYIVSGLEPKGEINVSIAIADFAGNTGLDETNTINFTNSAPNSSNTSVSIAEDTNYTFNVSDFAFVDADPFDSLAGIRVINTVSNGSLQLNGANVTTGALITTANLTAGALVYLPVANESGSPYDFFDFVVSDGFDNSSTVYNVTINVTAVNDAPSITTSIPVLTATEDSTVNVANLTSYVTDIDNSTIVFDVISSNESTVNASITDATNLTVTATSNYTGAVNLSLNATDNQYTIIFNVTVDVQNVNDAPEIVANITTLNATEDSSVIVGDISSLVSDVDNASLTYNVLSVNESDVTATFVNTSLLNITAVNNFTGLANVSINVSDEALDLVFTVPVNVLNVNDAPFQSASFPTLNLTEETSNSSIDLDSFFTDIDNTTLTYSIIDTTPSANVTATVISGNFINVTPGEDFYGTGAVNINISDGIAFINQTLSLNISNVDDLPLVQVISPNGGEVFVGNQTIVWNGTVRHDPLENLTYNVTLMINGTFNQSIANDTTLTFAAFETPTTFETDFAVINVTGVDSNGNVFTDLSDANFSMRSSDNTTPVLTYLEPINNSILTSQLVTLSVSVSEVPRVCNYTISPGAITGNLSGTQSNMSAVVNVSNDGFYNVIVGCSDFSAANGGQGNTGFTSANFSVDSTAPLLTLNSIPSVLNHTAITVSGNFTEANLVAINVFAINATTNSSSAASVSGSDFNASITLFEGGNLVQVIANDSFGRQGQANQTVWVDTVSPVVTPSNTNITSAASTVNFTGSITDANVTNVSVNGVAANLTGNNYQALVNISEGTSEVPIIATDVAGNNGSANVTVTIDLTNPSLSFNSFVTPTSSASQLVTGTFTEVNLDYIDVNGVNASTGASSFSTTVNLTDGNNTINATAVDLAGRSTLISGTIFADLIDPVVTLNSVTTPTATATQNITGTITETNLNSVQVNGANATIVGSNYWIVVALSEGVNVISINATDIVGREDTASAAITLDSTAPNVTAMVPTENSVIINSTPLINLTFTESVASVNATVNGQALVMNITGTSAAGQVLTALDNGTQTVSIQAVDSLGNALDINKTFEVDKTGTVRGFVTNSSSGGIFLATVNAINGSGATVATTTTNVLGRYELALEEGSYTINVTKSEFVSQNYAVTVNGSTDLQTNVTLTQASDISVENITFGQNTVQTQNLSIIAALIMNQGEQAENVTVRLAVNGTQNQTKVVTIPALSEVNVTFGWVAETGTHDITISTDALPEEETSNNQRTEQVMITALTDAVSMGSLLFINADRTGLLPSDQVNASEAFYVRSTITSTINGVDLVDLETQLNTNGFTLINATPVDSNPQLINLTSLGSQAVEFFINATVSPATYQINMTVENGILEQNKNVTVI